MAVVDAFPAWLVFCGTTTAIVRATDEDRAYEIFLRSRDPNRRRDPWEDHAPNVGRFVPPTRDEVTIRRPRESDRGWIEDSGDKAFLALLPELVDA